MVFRVQVTSCCTSEWIDSDACLGCYLQAVGGSLVDGYVFAVAVIFFFIPARIWVFTWVPIVAGRIIKPIVVDKTADIVRVDRLLTNSGVAWRGAALLSDDTVTRTTRDAVIARSLTTARPDRSAIKQIDQAMVFKTLLFKQALRWLVRGCAWPITA